MRNFLDAFAPLRSPEGGGAAGEPGGGAPAAPGGGFALPQGFDQKFAGATPEETISKLWGGYAEVATRAEGLRTKLAGLPKAPEKPELYSYDPSEKLKPYFGDQKDMPALDLAKAAFHKHGIPQEAFAGIIEDLYGPMVDQGLIAAPYSPQREIETYMKASNLDAAGATRALSDAATFAQGLAGQLKGVPDAVKADVQALLVSMTDTAAGNFLLQALAGRLAENGIRIAGEGGGAGVLTAEDLRKLDSDPRIDPANRDHPDAARRYDEDLRKRYDEAYRRMAPQQKAPW